MARGTDHPLRLESMRAGPLIGKICFVFYRAAWKRLTTEEPPQACGLGNLPLPLPLRLRLRLRLRVQHTLLLTVTYEALQH